ncbi:MAG: hypothetical protein V4641_05650 [Pseudomonadota bacterium]
MKATACAPDKYVPTEEKKGGWDDYEIRDALRTLSQADKIRKNKPLMGAIKMEAQKQLKVAAATASTLQGGNK